MLDKTMGRRSAWSRRLSSGKGKADAMRRRCAVNCAWRCGRCLPARLLGCSRRTPTPAGVRHRAVRL